ncbi:DUF6883 domain-containing protein [Cyanobacterium sp. DS4]|uniref:DUF6883 domain-containing protein n=1 Tax=Cyanobacterium sp. DS4 TaxID=2878255 RepID=UPI002E81D2B7|nr:DUF6883 domain-containing protein [Cyanobacterium sp. Dongsha4]WVL01969.1 hypothetical protein Dongsha4_07220 [Cyanobacterium sp. Dongsha4]
MKLPQDAIITEAKLTKYLLKWKPIDDKSQFLLKAGYTITTAKQLEKDLREQILPLNAVYTESNNFGEKYEIKGQLKGINGVILIVITILSG